MLGKYHQPVLLGEILEGLKVKENAGRWFIDATLGDGGHSLAIVSLGANVLSIDVDPEAIERVKDRLGKQLEESSLRLVRGNFRDLPQIVERSGFKKGELAGVLFDLGVSSWQLESDKRGFSFSKTGPLDMRMDPELQVRALDLVKALNAGELNELFSKMGEEKYSRDLAKAVVSARQVKSIETTMDLARIAEQVYRRKKIKKQKINPATKIFQALRITVNDELSALEEGLPQALEVVGDQGRIAVISFHSLEDRIVKNVFRRWQDEKLGKVLTSKPTLPQAEEVEQNPRSRSAKLRIFEKGSNL